MLVTHPITEFVYKHGYNGVDDLFNYWYENKDDILKLIKKKNRRLLQDDNLVFTFELKLRWSTWIGRWFRFYTDIATKNLTKEFDFHKVAIRYGSDTLHLDDLYDMVSKNVDKIDSLDLRGISLIHYIFRDVTFENIDFSYSTLDLSEFYNVTFHHCSFNKTSFYRSKLVNCTFDKSCRLYDNDFNNAFISGDYNCPIVNPLIKQPTVMDLYRIKRQKSSIFYFTMVNSESFIDSCNNKQNRNKLKQYIKHYIA